MPEPDRDDRKPSRILRDMVASVALSFAGIALILTFTLVFALETHAHGH